MFYLFPEDVVVGKKMEGDAKIKELSEVNSDDIILDIGPKTIEEINNIIDLSKTILWNGQQAILKILTSQMEVLKLEKIAEKNKLKEIFSVVGGRRYGCSNK